MLLPVTGNVRVNPNVYSVSPGYRRSPLSWWRLLAMVPAQDKIYISFYCKGGINCVGLVRACVPCSANVVGSVLGFHRVIRRRLCRFCCLIGLIRRYLADGFWRETLCPLGTIPAEVLIHPFVQWSLPLDYRTFMHHSDVFLPIGLVQSVHGSRLEGAPGGHRVRRWLRV